MSAHGRNRIFPPAPSQRITSQLPEGRPPERRARPSVRDSGRRVQVADVRVIQRRDRLRLALTVEARITHAIHLAHPPAPSQGEHFIGAEARARLEGHDAAAHYAAPSGGS